MKDDSPSSQNDKQQNPEALRSFMALREAFLDLHKTLLESERVGYEEAFGTIPSPNAFLQLTIQDPWFAWLRPLSAFITSLDERMEADEPVTERDVADYAKSGRALLRPQETGEGFGKHYFDAMQRDPDVILAHGRVATLHLD
jgi:hypothetical protein